MKEIYRRISVFLFCIVCCLCTSRAQIMRGWGADGSVYLSSPYGNYIADIGGSRYWSIGKFLTIGTGAKLSYVHMGNLGEWYTKNEHYSFNDDDPLISLDGIGNVALNFPIVKQIGVYCDASVSFSIIPWDYVEIKKYHHDTPINYDTKSIYAFNKFSPRLFTGAGVYYDFKQEGSILRVALGYGYGYYDALQGCRNVTYDGQKLSEHIPNASHLHRVILKVILFK